MKALIVILETFETQAATVDTNIEQWTNEVKKVQPLILQLLDITSVGDQGNNDIERCRQVSKVCHCHSYKNCTFYGSYSKLIDLEYL